MGKTVILLGGKKRSGKDTTGSILKDKLEKLGKRVDVFAFATPLKELCEENFNPLFRLIEEAYGIKIPGDFREEKSPFHRLILERVGTDIIRKMKPSHWVDNISTAISNSKADVIIVTDFRFPNEFHGLTTNFDIDEIVTCQVIRPHLPKLQGEHESEIALDGFKFDHVIINKGDLSELAFEVDLTISQILA